jgi:hypothetical protein
VVLPHTDADANANANANTNTNTNTNTSSNADAFSTRPGLTSPNAIPADTIQISQS